MSTDQRQVDPATPSLVPDPDVVARRLGEGAVLVHVASGRVFEVNDSGARIWELIGEGLAVDRIVEQLTREFDVELSHGRQQVRAFVRRMQDEGILSVR